MDNASVHKAAGVSTKKPSKLAAQLLFTFQHTAPTSIPLNNFLHKLKAILRKIAAYALKNAAYTVDSLCKAIVLCLDEIPRSECAAYLANSGYGQPKRKTL